ncbi:molybdate ABC transporter substrate-binding protein [uncultured Psychrosphaera sp.]|uniref:molybdate ABC transporter substrate-binding protein n=1 Tax=uncultured Psychrosphaera sp. TaxID=1403522 RepID=UPI0026183840|nr:molybdate ABC transporter substrate-binding protein [uncultured Psychrosphaera sp.]
MIFKQTINRSIPLYFTLLFTCLISNSLIAKTDIKIAVASNFHYTLSELLKSYPPADKIQFKLSSGSSGMLYAQIKQGAPFDLFLSADSLRPSLLEQDNLTLSRHTYALGKLVLWANEKSRIQLKNSTPYSQVLSSHQGKLAYANPKLAPFGIATQQVLSYLKLDDEYKNRRILGNNVNQVFQFVDSGNVTLGFVPESLLLQAQQQLKHNKYQNYWLVPAQQYQVIKQQLVILKRSKYQTEVKELVDYLLSDDIQQQIQNMGYNSPNN